GRRRPASGTECGRRRGTPEIRAGAARIEARDATVDPHGNLAVRTHRQELRWLRPPERLPAPWHHERLVPELLFRERDAYLGAERTQHAGPELHLRSPSSARVWRILARAEPVPDGRNRRKDLTRRRRRCSKRPYGSA